MPPISTSPSAWGTDLAVPLTSCPASFNASSMSNAFNASSSRTITAAGREEYFRQFAIVGLSICPRTNVNEYPFQMVKGLCYLFERVCFSNRELNAEPPQKAAAASDREQTLVRDHRPPAMAISPLLNMRFPHTSVVIVTRCLKRSIVMMPTDPPFSNRHRTPR